MDAGVSAAKKAKLSNGTQNGVSFFIYLLLVFIRFNKCQSHFNIQYISPEIIIHSAADPVCCVLYAVWVDSKGINKL